LNSFKHLQQILLLIFINITYKKEKNLKLKKIRILVEFSHKNSHFFDKKGVCFENNRI